MKPMILSPRLLSVAGLIVAGSKVADIGTDHGFLPIWLAQNGISGQIIATDVREKPLRRAESNLKKYAVTDKVKLYQCNGLSAIKAEDADTVVIAGMGGETIAGILAQAPWMTDGRHSFILQPMSAAEKLRRFLAENGFCIETEKLVKEQRRLYLVIKARGGKMEICSRTQYYTGVCLNEDPYYPEYLAALTYIMKKALNNMKNTFNQEDIQRKKLFQEVLDETIKISKQIQ